jgi:beta-alanine--pyruvate transaminase
MGAVVVREDIHGAFMESGLPSHAIELPHGYTYSGHPVACAAALATLEHLENEALPARVASLAVSFEQDIQNLRSCSDLVVDIRNFGLAGAIQLAPRDGDSTIRPYEAGLALWDRGWYVRWGGDTLQFGPPFTSSGKELNDLFTVVAEVLSELD